jgi:hypothetical protein
MKNGKETFKEEDFRLHKVADSGGEGESFATDWPGSCSKGAKYYGVLQGV